MGQAISHYIRAAVKIRCVLTLSKIITAGYALLNFHANYCKTDGKKEQHEYHHQHTIRIK
jgi:hypothetical protein